MVAGSALTSPTLAVAEEVAEVVSLIRGCFYDPCIEVLMLGYGGASGGGGGGYQQPYGSQGGEYGSGV